MPKHLGRTSLVRRARSAVPIALLGIALVSAAPAAARGHRRAAVEQSTNEAPASTPPAESGSAPSPSEPSLTTPPPAAPALDAPPERVRRHGRCRVSLEASAYVVDAGETVTLLGHVSCPDATAAGGEQVAIYQREGASPTAMAALSTVTTGEQGSYQLTTHALTRKSVFLAESALGGRARTTIRVTPTVTLAGPAASGAVLASRGSRVRGPNRFTFSGTVSPTGEGGHVALQSEDLGAGESWHTIGRARLDDEGHFSISRSFRNPGEVEVRVLSHVRGEARRGERIARLRHCSGAGPGEPVDDTGASGERRAVDRTGTRGREDLIVKLAEQVPERLRRGSVQRGRGGHVLEHDQRPSLEEHRPGAGQHVQLCALDVDLDDVGPQAGELDIKRRDLHGELFGFAARIADLWASSQPAPSVELAEIAELGRSDRGSERQTSHVDLRKGRAQLGGEIGDRLEGDVMAAWCHARRLAQNLAAVGPHVHVCGVAAQGTRQDRGDRDLLAPRLAGAGVERGQQLRAIQSP